MPPVATATRYVDLQFLGRPHVIATAVLQTSAGIALVDPGPSTCLPRLRQALREEGCDLADVTSVLLTHIHLDHAGATGSLLQERPGLVVYVHERGAPHVIDPSKLVESAGRLYGEHMERLWGEVLPVPEVQVRILAGGEQLTLGDRTVEVAYTPGHAYHHVSYLDRSTGVAYAGDTAGIRIDGARYVIPPTPPPDVDLEAWRQSIELFRAWQPEQLFLTHCGPVRDVGWHLEELLARLDGHAALVQHALAGPDSDADQAAEFARVVAGQLRTHLTDDEASRYGSAVAAEHCWLGLARYWRKRQRAATA